MAVSQSTRGFSRDRTAAFTSMRSKENAYKTPFDDRDSARLLGGESTNGDGLSQVNAVAASAPPAWVSIQEEVTMEMAVMKQKMGELARTHKKATLPTFDDAGDSGAEQLIEVQTREITRMFRKAEQKLKSLGGHRASDPNSKVVKNVQQSLASELQGLSQEFRKQQKAYLQKLRKQQEVVGGPPGFGASRGGSSLLEGDYDQGFTESQILKSRDAENLVNERDREMVSIAKSVEELATIMRDLSVLVIDQGTVVDRIDYNMEEVSTKIEEGVKELKKAEKTQKSSRMMMCILCLFCACILMTLIVIFEKAL